jgi:hypothetical protein
MSSCVTVSFPLILVQPDDIMPPIAAQATDPFVWTEIPQGRVEGLRGACGGLILTSADTSWRYHAAFVRF